MSRDSSVGTVTKLGDGPPRNRGSITGTGIIHSLETGSGVHPGSYPMGNVAFFSGFKRPEREANHSPPFSTEITITCISISSPSFVFMA
jgi:hypothetical protein